MRILGIDPGLGITGYGVIDAVGNNVKLIEAGIIKSDAKQKIEKRLFDIYKKVRCLIKDTKPSEVVLEEVYSHYKHPKTSILMAHARGVICLAAEEGGIEIISYSPTRIKKAVTGSGRASKEQMQRTVMSLLGIKDIPGPFDITDALALAIARGNVLSHSMLHDTRHTTHVTR